MKPIIGIVPKAILYDPEGNSTDDVYHLGNNYTRQLENAGATPICLAPVDGQLSQEQLALCDGFLVQGGRKMWPYHFQTIHHAFTTGKRYLGICLGMQLIHRYYVFRRLALEQGLDPTYEAICSLFFSQNKRIGDLAPVEGHRYEGMPRHDTECAKHSVDLVPGTMLHRLFGKDSIRAASFHSYCCAYAVPGLTVNAWSPDGIIEGVENGSNLLGVQFHPEVDDQLPQVFDFLTAAE